MLKSDYLRGRGGTRSFNIVYVNYELEEFIYLLDVMSSVFDKINTNQPNRKLLHKVFSSFYCFSISFYSRQDDLEHLK